MIAITSDCQQHVIVYINPPNYSS